MTDVQTEIPPPESLVPGGAPDRDERSRVVSIVLWTLLGLAFLTVALVTATESALHFGGVPIDGPFQLYNAMRRIAAGFRPGIDFQFFHGLGLPYLYYGLFRLFGGGLRGSELARSLVSPIAFTIVLVVTMRTFAGRWTRTACLTATGLAFAFTIPIYGVFAALIFAVNGMLGVRSSLPTLVPVALFLARTRRQRVLAGGLVLGLALLFSTEQGIAVTVAYVVVSLIATFRRSAWRAQLLEAALTLALAVATLCTGLRIIAGPTGAVGALRYNFATVPGDQYWYFGAPPNVFAPSWGAAVRMTLALWPIGFGLLFGVAATALYLKRLWVAPEGELGRRHFALAVLPTYGLLACGSLLGVFTPVYTQPCWRTVLLVALIEWSRLGGGERGDARPRVTAFGVPRRLAISASVLAIFAVAGTPLVRTALFGRLSHVLSDHVFGHQPFEATPMWIETLAEGQRVINAHRGPRGEPPVLWSTYSGWIEARNDIFNPSFDYIIHALGESNRREYDDGLRTVRPTLVQTVRPTYTQYEPWLENTSWPFYAELLRSYEVADMTRWSIYWERRQTTGPDRQLIGSMQVPAGADAVQLPPVPAPLAAPVSVYEIELDYQTRNPLHWLPVIGRIPRYLVGISGALSENAISLDPFTTRMRFPVVARAGQNPILFFRTASLLPGARYVPRVIRVFVVPIAPANQLWLADLVERLGQHDQ